MSFKPWLRFLKSTRATSGGARKRAGRRKQARRELAIERLEDRALPSGLFGSPVVYDTGGRG